MFIKKCDNYIRRDEKEIKELFETMILISKKPVFAKDEKRITPLDFIKYRVMFQVLAEKYEMDQAIKREKD
jgi:hypothetical protein